MPNQKIQFPFKFGLTLTLVGTLAVLAQSTQVGLVGSSNVMSLQQSNSTDSGALKDKSSSKSKIYFSYLTDQSEWNNSEEAQNKSKAKYNVLSIDGGGVRGLIPAKVIQYFEDQSYKIALEKNYINVQDYPGQKYPMHELFDMIAGTSSGGILTAALVTPSESNPLKAKYNSDVVVSLYEEQGPEVFKKQQINPYLLSFLIIGSVVLCGGLGYIIGKKKYANPLVEQTHDQMRAYIKQLKKEVRHPQEDKETGTATAIGDPLFPGQELTQKMRRWAIKQVQVVGIENGDRVQDLIESDDIWKIKEAERLVTESEGKYKENKQKKWISMFIGVVIGSFLGFLIPTAIFKISYAVYDTKSVDKIYTQMFGAVNINQVLTNEALFVAYSYNAQEPRFYSKLEAKANPEVYNVSLDLAVSATSATPGFFKPKVYVNGKNETELLVDGSVIANNPSMYAFLYAQDSKKAKNNTRIVSIGAGAQRVKKLDPKKTSILTWVTQIETLLLDVEVASHSYFTKFLSEDYHRFQVAVEEDLIDNLEGNNLEKLKEMASDMITTHKEEIHQVIGSILDEKYAK